MITLKNYKINMENFKNSYINDINFLKKLLGLNSNSNIDDMLKSSYAEKDNNYCFKIIINKENISFRYFFILNKEDNKYFLSTSEIELENKIEIKKEYSSNNDLYEFSIYKLFYSYNYTSVSYIKVYHIHDSTLSIIYYNNKEDEITYYNDINIYYKSKKFYFINNKIYFTFPTNIKKYKNLIEYINLTDNLIILKRSRIYILYLYLNKKLNINECRKLMNLINSKILMLYII